MRHYGFCKDFTGKRHQLSPKIVDILYKDGTVKKHVSPNKTFFKKKSDNTIDHTINTTLLDFINKHMVNDINAIGEWNVELKDLVIAGNGSIQHIKRLPAMYRRLYQTQWELKQIWVLKAAKARGPFVDQTQSMNIFMEEPNDQKLNSCLFWGWKNGLKSGIYYLRSKPSSNAIKFTIDPKIMKELYNSDECDMCSA